MDWLTLGAIIGKEGLAVGEAIYNKWSSGQMPTAADFAELRALGKQTPEALVLKVADLTGLPADDPKILELLNLVKLPPIVPAPAPPTPPTPPAA